jgi:hypothetical protein
MNTPKTPSAPDFTQLARESANSGRYNVVTPTGSSTWTAPTSGIATNTQALTPAQQQIFSQRQGIETAALANASPLISNPTINQALLPRAPVNPGATGQQAIMARLQPELQRQRDALHTQLANWGLNPTSEAYKDMMRQQSERENDLLTQATLQGISLDNAARQNAIAEQQTFLGTPINALNAFRTGQQVAVGSGGGTDYVNAAAQQYNAAMDRYRSRAGQYNDWTSAAMQLAPYLFS